MKAKLFVPMLGMFAMMIAAGCESTAPNSPTENAALTERAHAALTQMEVNDPTLRNRTDNSYAFAIFPEVGKGAVGIGGEGGKGVVYQGGRVVGYATLNEGSVGPQLGGQTFAELIVFKNSDAMASFRNGDLTLGADAEATAVKAGAASATQFKNGTQIFILPKGGLMAGAAIHGQVIHFIPDNSGNNGM